MKDLIVRTKTWAAVGALAFGGWITGPSPAQARNAASCGTVDSFVQVSAVHVGCKVAKKVARAAEAGRKPPHGFKCRKHSVEAGAGHYYLCSKGRARVTATPE
jgi:hypothetical protein